MWIPVRVYIQVLFKDEVESQNTTTAWWFISLRISLASLQILIWAMPDYFVATWALTGVFA